MSEEHAVQTAALAAAYHQPGYAFFMEQGLGKTYTVLKEFEGLVQERLATRLVIICPNSFKSGWVDEIEKWGFDFEPYIFESGAWANAAFVGRKFGRAPVLIINVEAIRSESTQELIATFVGDRECYVAMDESILISTHDAAQTKAALATAKLFAFRRVLSGKPMKQGPHDLWSQMRFIGALDGRNYFAFRNAFCRMGGFKMKQVMGAQNEDILARLIDPYIFRATKADWTDLPPKVQMIREYELVGEMKTMFKSMYEDFVVWLNEDEVVTVDAAITKYIKLAQIQAGFIYDENGKTRELVAPAQNPRLNLLRSIVDNEIPGKACVVYHHKPVYDTLMNTFSNTHSPAWIKGGMEPSEIDYQKKRFNEDTACRLIFLQDDASKYGHTLVGQPEPQNHCSDEILYQNNYSLDTRSQIEDRIHRYGQLGDMCRYWDLVGTLLDKDCVKALFRKESVFQAVFSLLGGSAPSAQSQLE